MTDHPILSFYSPEMVLCFDLGQYQSLRWRPKYDSPGEFELHTNAKHFSRVYRGQLILRADRPKETVKVEGIVVEGNSLVLTGRFLSAVLSDASISKRYMFNCTIEEAVRKLVAEQYGRTPRTLTMKLAAARGFPERITAQVSLKNLLIVSTAMAKAGGLGFRVYAVPAEQCLYFEMYKGIDRTEAQAENARVTFSKGDADVAAIAESLQSFQRDKREEFNTWFEEIKGTLSGDVAGNLTLKVNTLEEQQSIFMAMVMNNDFFGAILDDDGNPILDDDGEAVVGEWKYLLA